MNAACTVFFHNYIVSPEMTKFIIGRTKLCYSQVGKDVLPCGDIRHPFGKPPERSRLDVVVDMEFKVDQSQPHIRRRTKLLCTLEENAVQVHLGVV